ncbi:MAG: ribonuclease III [Anaerolineales bacterium]|nr:ribonuclease III [Anaerolineales bacterium]
MFVTQVGTGEESPQALAQRLGLQFRDYLLLSRALTHRSYLNEHPEALEDNERLEFLGDAVLDFLAGAWLYNRFPEMAEGQLTSLRSALVRTEQLADFARQIQLANAMRLGRGEAESGGYDRPALLCATFEALIGALYLDAGIAVVKNFVEPLLESMADEILLSGRTQDPKSKLQEWTQARGEGAPTYRTVAAYGPDHAKTFEIEVVVNGEVVGLGYGHSKQEAAKVAAHQALKNLPVD